MLKRYFSSFGPFCLWWHWLVIFALFENSFGHVWAGKPLPSAAHSTTSMNCRLIKAVLIHHLTIMCLASNTLTTYHWQESLCNYITATEGGWSYGQLLITRGCRDDRRPTVCHDLSKTITFLSFAILFQWSCLGWIQKGFPWCGAIIALWCDWKRAFLFTSVYFKADFT